MSIPSKRPGAEQDRARRAGRAGDNREAYRQLGQTLAQEAVALCEKLADLEDRIALQGELLRISQPPMPGKYDIRWWARRGWLYPTLVKWVKPDAHGRLQVQTINRKRYQRTDHNFALNAAATRDLIKQYSEAQARVGKGHEKIARTVAHLQIIRRGIEIYDSALQDQIEDLRRQIVENLMNAGYAVEERYLSLEAISRGREEAREDDD
jgi:hypothetical protein